MPPQFRPLLIVLTVVACLTTACLDRGPEFPGVDEGFTEVSLNKSPGAFYCFDVGEVVATSVDASDDGFQGRSTVIGEGDPEEDQCLNYDGSDGCHVHHEAGPIELSDEQIDELVDLLAAIPEKRCRTQPGTICDPCTITSITVDDHSVDRFCCGSLNDDFREGFNAAVDYLEGLGHNIASQSAE